MHRRRRVVYAAVASALAELQKEGKVIPAFLCGLLPRDSLFSLSSEERGHAVLALLRDLVT